MQKGSAAEINVAASTDIGWFVGPNPGNCHRHAVERYEKPGIIWLRQQLVAQTLFIQG